MTFGAQQDGRWSGKDSSLFLLIKGSLILESAQCFFFCTFSSPFLGIVPGMSPFMELDDAFFFFFLSILFKVETHSVLTVSVPTSGLNPRDSDPLSRSFSSKR